MALKRNERYPGRFSNPTTAQPQGAFKNRTAPSSQDGSFLEQDWANDWSGFFGRLLTVAGATANGNVDTALSSQYYDALLAATPGRLLNVKVITSSGTYTTTPGTKRIIVECQGGGGGGGGAAVITAGTATLGGGGTSGMYAMHLIDNPSSSYAVVVGAGGTGGTGGNPGGNGTTSSFGSVISCPGGVGGATLPASSSVAVIGNTTSGTTPVIVGGNIAKVDTSSNTNGVRLTNTGYYSGSGGASKFGPGGSYRGVSGDGGTPLAYGAGGSGAANSVATATPQNGGNGAMGVIIVWEYA